MAVTAEEIQIKVTCNIDETRKKLDELKAKIDDTFKKQYMQVEAQVKASTTAIAQANEKVAQSAGQAKKEIKKANDNIKQVSKTSEKASGGITKLAKRFKTLAIAMVIRQIIRQAIQGFKDLAQYSSNFNGTMSQLQAQFTAVRNSIAVALAPVLEALTPVIITITNAIINLFNALAKINTILFTNKTSFTKAKVATTDYAKSLNSASKSAKGALASFDELNVLQQNDSSSSGVATPAEMFETEEIDRSKLDGIYAIAEKIKEAFDNIKINKIDLSKLTNGLITDMSNLPTQLKPIIDKIGHIINGVYTDYFEPAFNLVKTVFIDTFTIISNTWAEYGEPIFNGMIEAINNIMDIVTLLWDKAIAPILGNIINGMSKLWDEHLKGLVENIAGMVADIIELTLVIYNKVIAPIIKWVADLLLPVISGAINILIQGFYLVIGVVADMVNDTINAFRGIIQFITGVFTGDWNKAVGGIKLAFGGIVNDILTIVEGLINGIIYCINKFINGINTAIAVINEIPGVTLPTLTTIPKANIPKLAKGGVLTETTTIIAGEYAGAKDNPEIVSPQNIMYETNVKANVPVMNAIEEMADNIVNAMNNMSVYADFSYDKLTVGLNKENKRQGNKIYGGAY